MSHNYASWCGLEAYQMVESVTYFGKVKMGKNSKLSRWASEQYLIKV